MAGDWTDRIVGARMAVDREFTDTLQQSGLSRQEWGLVMTAVDFNIEGPEDPATAQLVADISKLEAVVPELERVGSMEQQMRGGGGSSSSGPLGGILGSLKDSLGIGDSGPKFDEERIAEAERLVGQYSSDLQAFLSRRGRWEEVCMYVAEHGDGRD